MDIVEVEAMAVVVVRIVVVMVVDIVVVVGEADIVVATAVAVVVDRAAGPVEFVVLKSGHQLVHNLSRKDRME